MRPAAKPFTPSLAIRSMADVRRLEETPIEQAIQVRSTYEIFRNVAAAHGERNALTFLRDGVATGQITRAEVTRWATWPFDKPFFLLINLAMGGTYAGSVPTTLTAPQRYVIDCPFPQQFDSEKKESGGVEIGWDEVMVRWKGRGPMNETYVAKLQKGYRG